MKNLYSVLQRPVMVLDSAQEENGTDLLTRALSTATCTSHSGADLLGINSRTLTLASGKVWLPICLLCQCRAFLPPLHATLPDASKKTPIWLHVPTAII